MKFLKWASCTGTLTESTNQNEILNYIDFDHSIANSSLFPTFMYLHLNFTQLLALKKTFFSLFRFQKIKKKIFVKKVLCNFSVQTL